MEAAKVIQLKPRTTAARKAKNDGAGTMAGKGLTDEQMRMLFDRFGVPVTEADFRNRALLAVMAATGLRAREVVNLRFSARRTTPEGDAVFVYIRKGGAFGYAYIPDSALDCVTAYHTAAGIRDDLFFLALPTNARRTRGGLTTRALQMIVSGWNMIAGDGRPMHPHTLRHTVGQKALDRFGSIAAQKILGHSTPATTSRYYTRPYYVAQSALF